MSVKMKKGILAERLGLTYHVSPLRYKIKALSEKYPADHSDCIEDWLIDVSNSRGACIVFRPNNKIKKFNAPTVAQLTNEELIVSICQLQCLDYPQMIRLAAQLISRGEITLKSLFLIAERERVEPVLKELANQALKVDKNHSVWKKIHEKYKDVRPLKDSLLHWTRLAEPVMKDGMVNASHWRLVS